MYGDFVIASVEYGGLLITVVPPVPPVSITQGDINLPYKAKDYDPSKGQVSPFVAIQFVKTELPSEGFSTPNKIDAPVLNSAFPKGAIMMP